MIVHNPLKGLFRRGERDTSHIEPLEYEFQRLKSRVHQELVESLDLSRLDEIDQGRMRKEIGDLAAQLSKKQPEVLRGPAKDRLVDDLMAEFFGLGPLERFMHDADITDILVNDVNEIYVERSGRLELTNAAFADRAHLMRIIQRVVSRTGRRIDEVNAMVDARMPDGSRVNAVVPPLAVDGPSLSIRRFGNDPLRIESLQQSGSILPEMVEFLAAAIEARISFLIAGGTGAGKTTLLNALSAFIPDDERLVSIEDSAELILQHRHVVRLETRPANSEGTGVVSQRDLVRNALRMRPDRILVGEVRGPEALDMLQAMNTGHEGSLTTIHANDTHDALARLEMMVSMTGFDLPVPVIRHYISSGIKLVVHLARLKGGVRRVMKVSEIVEIRDGEFRLEDIFGFEQTGVRDGYAQGEFYVTGYRPACLKRLQAAGCEVPLSLFEPRRIACDRLGAKPQEPSQEGESGS